MLNAGSLFTLVAHSLLGLALGTVATSSPVANPAAPTPLAVQAPIRLASNDDSSGFVFTAPDNDARSSIQSVMKQISEDKDIKPELKEKLLSALQSVLEVVGDKDLIAPKVLRFDTRAMPEIMPPVERSRGKANTSKDVTIRIKGKDGKWKELKNPSEAELKKLEAETGMKFRRFEGPVDNRTFVVPKIDLRGLEGLERIEGLKDLEILKDLSVLNGNEFMKLHDFDKSFNFKLDKDAMKEMQRSMEEMRKSMRDMSRSNEKLERSRSELQRELERVRAQREALNERERVLRELIERTKDSKPAPAPRNTSV